MNKPTDLELLARLHALPDTASLTTQEAAVFLRCSISKLEALRGKGIGPVYSQGGTKECRGVNQPCLYEKADLLAWLRSQKVSSIKEATVRKGQV